MQAKNEQYHWTSGEAICLHVADSDSLRGQTDEDGGDQSRAAQVGDSSKQQRKDGETNVWKCIDEDGWYLREDSVPCAGRSEVLNLFRAEGKEFLRDLSPQTNTYATAIGVDHEYAVPFVAKLYIEVHRAVATQFREWLLGKR